MKTFLIVVLSLVVLGALVALAVTLFTPRMDRWGATDAEIEATFPGDELLAEPAKFANRSITIQASPEQIYPWLVQIGADKGGWYSYDWLESLFGCKITNADRVHSEWQDLQVGDEVLMCPEGSGPPPYIIAQVHPNQAIVLGHQDDGQWVDVWQWVLIPQADGSTRLVNRTRTMMVGGVWNIFQPIAFVMEERMLRGIRDRAEAGLP